MARYDYVLPSGESYVLVVPEGTSHQDADIMFYSQVAAGALVGLQSGDTIASTTIENKTFHLSRLQRGTAGVDDKVELAVHVASDILAGLMGSITTSNAVPSMSGNVIATATSTQRTTSGPPLDDDMLRSIVENLPLVSGLPNLTDVPASDPIDQADVMMADNDLREVGPLSKFDIQALEAQIARMINQDYDVMTVEKGIGKYGLTCYQLEKTGHVKPCTQAMFIDSDYPAKFLQVMNSPTIWTGLDGVNDISDILTDEHLQNKIQNDLMLAGYSALKTMGAVVEPPGPAKPKEQSWVFTGGTLTGTSLQQLSAIGQAGGTRTEFGALIAAAGTDYSSIASGAAPNIIDNSFNTTKYYYDKVQSTMQVRANMQIGVLVANASKFGPEPTVVWSQTNNGRLGYRAMVTQAQGVMNATTTQMNKMMALPDAAGFSASTTNPIVSTNVVGNFTNSSFGANGLTSLPNDVLNQASNAMNIMNGNMDLMGKAAQFSMSFSNIGDKVADLTSLSKLSDLAGSGFDKLSGVALSQVNQLQGLADGAMNRLTTGFDGISKSFGDLAKIDLGSMSDIGKLTGLASGIPGVGGMISGGLGQAQALAGQFSGMADKFKSLASMDFSKMFSGDFSKMFGGGDALTAGIKKAVGVTGTINRDTVDAAVSKIIGSGKIPDPSFTIASSSSSGLSDMSFAKSKLSDLGVTTFGAGSDSASLAAKYGSSVPVFSQNQINRSL